MREIKFRGLGTDGHWWYGEINPQGENHINLATFFPNLHVGAIKPETVGEYTGLKDKNGKEIYEGDAIKGIFNGYPQNWQVNDLSAYDLTFTRLTDKPLNSPYFFRNMRHIDQWEVIGNIHENPELLGK